MLNIILAITTIFLYLFAGTWQIGNLLGKYSNSKHYILCTALLAVLCHAILLYHWIDIQGGQNLAPFNVLSQIAWLIAVLVILIAFIKPVANLGALVYPFAAISILISWCFPGINVINTAANSKQLFHILLAFLVTSVFVIAAIQALFLNWQNHLLRSRQTTGIVTALPPLETMETLLFQMIRFGFVLLNLVLITSIIFFKNIFAKGILQHTVLALLAWLVFAILLWGRKVFGWRGRTAIIWILSGVSLILLSYWLVLEIF